MAKRASSSRRPYDRLAIAFLGAVALVAVFVALSSLARVRIVITPRIEPLRVDTSVTVLGSGPVVGDAVLGRLVRTDGTADVRLSVGGGTAVAAAETAPPVRARGTVTLVSTLGTPQALIATTRLRAPDGALFRMEKGATIPARGRLDGVAVYADQPGVRGNIGPTKFTIPGLSKWLQERVWAESTAPMSGGSGTPPVGAVVGSVPELPMVRAEDVAAVEERARSTAREDAHRRALALAKDGEEFVILDATTQLTTIGAAGERRAQLQARAVVTISGVFVPRDALRAAATGALERLAAASGRTMLRVRPETLTHRIVTYDPATAQATIAVELEGDAVLEAGKQSFEPNRIAGFTPDGVRTYLRSIPGVQDVEVQLWPFWVKRVPTNVGKVDVEVRTPEAK